MSEYRTCPWREKKERKKDAKLSGKSDEAEEFVSKQQAGNG
jgi:hypothetical protein